MMRPRGDILLPRSTSTTEISSEPAIFIDPPETCKHDTPSGLNHPGTCASLGGCPSHPRKPPAALQTRPRSRSSSNPWPNSKRWWRRWKAGNRTWTSRCARSSAALRFIGNASRRWNRRMRGSSCCSTPSARNPRSRLRRTRHRSASRRARIPDAPNHGFRVSAHPWASRDDRILRSLDQPQCERITIGHAFLGLDRRNDDEHQRRDADDDHQLSGNQETNAQRGESKDREDYENDRDRDVEVQRFLRLIVHERHRVLFHQPDDQGAKEPAPATHPAGDQATQQRRQVREHRPLAFFRGGRARRRRRYAGRRRRRRRCHGFRWNTHGCFSLKTVVDGTDRAVTLALSGAPVKRHSSRRKIRLPRVPKRPDGPAVPPPRCRGKPAIPAAIRQYPGARPARP